MKKLFLLTFFLLATTIKINAQDNNSYIEFVSTQIEIAKKISKEKITSDFSFNQGVEYQNKYFWYVTAKDEKKHYFNSNKNFTEITYIEEDYRSLMEYIMEESDF
ncbi:hypothetical protein PG913_07355 [Tenacibaculum pacificus]|uniref:hypothetical protein n=1 Tax=Tenacibaculum pacificus TaxID=3018314 RepID=UPI0022F3A7A1|nr:hypothetical protein [Tenacibaculum pacificus]WBX72728.1 hypothetical protein PG913_07355 [Tenacibaculum pacificus]